MLYFIKKSFIKIVITIFYYFLECCGYNITVTKFKEENLRAIVIIPPTGELISVELEDNKIWELTKFFNIKTFTVLEEKTKIEDKIVEILVIDEVKEEEIEDLIKNCNTVKIK